MAEPLIVIQARLNSTRLPSKVLMSIGEDTMLSRIYQRVGRYYRIIACPTGETAMLRECGWPMIIREAPVSEDDVLGRFFWLTVNQRDPIVRLTADCPLIDPAVIDRALEEYDGTRLVVSTVAPEYTEGYPDGQDVEVFSREMLEEAFVQTDKLPTGGFDAYENYIPGTKQGYREHVTAWMREHCDVKVLDYAQPVPNVKLSVDTWDDLLRVRKIVAALGPDCTLEEIYGWLATNKNKH